MKAFHIKINGKYYDYRIGHEINLSEFRKFLNLKGYKVEKIWHEKRHAVGILERNNKKLFVKLSTSEGMNFTTKNEYLWNEKMNPLSKNAFLFPININSGFFNELFYFIVEYQEGELFAKKPNPEFEHAKLENNLKNIIQLAEFIQSKNVPGLNPDGDEKFEDFSKRFIIRTKSWYREIPIEIRNKYYLHELLMIVEEKTKNLDGRLRHGDFTPWHIFLTPEEKLFIFDGERAMSKDVENYDICFFIQRIYSVLEDKKLALEILDELRNRKYDFHKLKIVLASRAIGGFLDRSLHVKPDYSVDVRFKNQVLEL